MLKVKNLGKSYDGSRILNNVTLEVETGEFVAVMGHSGCGKTTLLYCVSGMDHFDEGEVLFDGKSLGGCSEKEIEALRLFHMGFIFQKTNFLKNLSIEDNIIFPAFQAKRKSRGEIVSRAEALMEQVGIRDVAANDSRKVSGGQLQRAAICRAMINEPKILFGDEPTGALNSGATEEVMGILEDIHRRGTTVMLVTHDANVAKRADRVIYLEDGKIKDVYKRENALITLREWLEKLGF